MRKIKRENVSKKQICEELYKKFGLPKLYIEEFFNDTICMPSFRQIYYYQQSLNN